MREGPLDIEEGRPSLPPGSQLGSVGQANVTAISAMTTLAIKPKQR